MTRHPEITFLESLSEAPDEVASGDWLKALAAAGVEASMAHARFLAELPEDVGGPAGRTQTPPFFKLSESDFPLPRSYEDRSKAFDLGPQKACN